MKQRKLLFNYCIPKIQKIQECGWNLSKADTPGTANSPAWYKAKRGMLLLVSLFIDAKEK